MAGPGAMGPGWPGSPDLVGRLHEHGAGGARARGGLFLRNYWTTRGRKRGARRFTPELVDAVQYALDGLMRRLRDQPGINVRRPSHHAPPFRATQWTWQAGDIADNLPLFAPYGVTFNQTDLSIGFGDVPQPVPDGLRGVVTRAIYNVFNLPEVTATATRLANAVCSILHNGQPAPGYSNLRPAGLAFEEILDGSGSDNYGALVRKVLDQRTIGTPIILEPGDTLQVNFNSGGFQNWLTLQGWLYPIELEADGIKGTLADRGAVQW